MPKTPKSFRRFVDYIDNTDVAKGEYVSTAIVMELFWEVTSPLKEKKFADPDYNFQIYDTLEASGHKLSPNVLEIFVTGMKNRESDMCKTLKILHISNKDQLMEHLMVASIKMNEVQRDVLRANGTTNLRMFQAWTEEHKAYTVDCLSNHELHTIASILAPQ
jgi:hypothetical protein